MYINVETDFVYLIFFANQYYLFVLSFTFYLQISIICLCQSKHVVYFDYTLHSVEGETGAKI